MNFDKNTIIGFVLIALILIGFGIMQQPSEAEKMAAARQRDSLAQIQRSEEAREALKNTNSLQQNSVIADNNIPDSVKKAKINKEYGVFAKSAEGENSFITLENEKIRVKFSKLGGKVRSVELLNTLTFDGKPLLLFDGDSTVFGIGLASINKNTSDLYFEPQTNETAIKVPSDSEKSVSYRLYAEGSSYLEFKYTLPANDYILKFEISSNNMGDYFKSEYITFDWSTYIKSTEKGKTWESQNTTIQYQYFEDEQDYISPTSSDVETEKLTGKVKWIAFKHHFFSSIVVADEYFLRGGTITSTPLPVSNEHVKQFSASLDLPFAQNSKQKLSFYFGPNHYPTLESYNLGFEELINLGWGIFGWINRFVVIPVFNWLSDYLTNYGLIILLLTIIIKIVLFPMTYKSYLSTAKMRVLKPEVDKLNEKFKDKSDAMKKQQATMELYKKAGVNPLGGCIPMLIQLPILFAMFKFFPASIELRQKSFLWAEDLSTYDSIMSLPFEIPWYGSHVSLFTLLMCISMIFSTILTNKNMTTMPGQPNMKFMLWMMPVMMLFWFNSYSSGLSYYYFVANMITFAQTWIIRKTIDDQKLLAQLKENQKIPKKKSRFQMRLEEIQKQQKNRLK